MNKLKPALLGGLIVGILSAIPFLNYCCCIWGIGGGLLAGMLYIKSAPLPVKVGEGAVIGVLAGIIGGVIYFAIGLPIAYFISGAQLEETLSRAGFQLPAGLSGLALFAVSYLIGAISLLVLAIIGGLISVPIFEKRKDGPPPPPPPSSPEFVG
ncbi:MAG TPA: hypothetical protein VE931_08955 [Pyrinomonadaceae bacterium]|nr:hypothetical protein [Pyrinomonadaceae bacterium]